MLWVCKSEVHRSTGSGDSLQMWRATYLINNGYQKFVPSPPPRFIKAWTPGFLQVVGQSFLILEAENFGREGVELTRSLWRMVEDKMLIFANLCSPVPFPGFFSRCPNTRILFPSFYLKEKILKDGF